MNYESSNTLNVLTLSSFDHGGAGLGSIRRVGALRAHGINAYMLTLKKKSKKNYVHKYTPEINNKIIDNQDQAWQLVRQNAIMPVVNNPDYKARELFSLPYSVVDFDKIKDLIEMADIVHFHWVVGMLDFEKFGKLLADRPVVWTLADMNPFTGGCHYSEGCTGYEEECIKCPLLGNSNNVAHDTWVKKHMAYRELNNLSIICPSYWIAEKASKSKLFSGRPVYVINNAFPLHEFAPVNKIVARSKLGLPLEKKLILFGADNVTNHRKGGDIFIQALNYLADNYKDNNVEVIIYGNNKLKLNVPVHNIGYIHDNNTLSLAYSAADVYVFPSREDNSPLVVGESLLCGTPVVGFPVGNLQDIIEHQHNGYLANYTDFKDLAAGIIWVIENIKIVGRIKMINRCRQKAMEFHDPEKSAEHHIKLYKKISA